MEAIATGHAGLDTSLMFIRFAGEVERHGAHLVMRVPANPDFYNGNALVLPARPAGADRAALEAAFARLVGAPPAINHRTFFWPAAHGEAGNLDAFTQAGYYHAISPVLVARRGELAAPPPAIPGLEIRRYAADADWDEWKEMNLRELAQLYPVDAQHAFLDAERAMFARLEAAGRGHWWGAFLDGRQVAHLGLYFDGATGRFQSVMTEPAFRRRGVCAQLVHHVAALGLQRADTLVIVADETHGAGRLYQKLGFAPREWIGMLQWTPPPT